MHVENSWMSKVRFMLNIWTLGYYQQHSSELATSIDSADSLFCDIHFRHFDSKLREEFLNILQVIDNVIDVNFEDDSFRSPMTERFCDKDKLSSGCKTALLVLWYSLYARNNRVPVYLDEAGPNALTECLNVLENTSNVIGVLGTPLMHSEHPNKFTIRVNDDRIYHNWLGVLRSCRAEMEE